MKCPKCHSEQQAGYKFCSNCGTPNPRGGQIKSRPNNLQGPPKSYTTLISVVVAIVAALVTLSFVYKDELMSALGFYSRTAERKELIDRIDSERRDADAIENEDDRDNKEPINSREEPRTSDNSQEEIEPAPVERSTPSALKSGKNSFNGYAIADGKRYPFKLSFNYYPDSGSISNAVYDNSAYNTRIKMTSAHLNGNNVILSGSGVTIDFHLGSEITGTMSQNGTTLDIVLHRIQAIH